MDCAECGASLPAEARFCAVCGARQPDEEPLAVAEYQEALRELGPIDEAWARDELRALRGELRIREATHDRLLAELTRPALPVSAWVDAATMRDFRVGEQCLVRVRVVNEGRRALKRVVLRWRTSATEGEQEALAGCSGPAGTRCSACCSAPGWPATTSSAPP